MNYSESGFGARVDNAQKMLEQLKTMGGYTSPKNDLTIENIERVLKSSRSTGETLQKCLQFFHKIDSFNNSSNTIYLWSQIATVGICYKLIA